MTDKNREIEEIRKDLIEIFDEEYDKRRIITADFTAEALYNAGYRKQVKGEWIDGICTNCGHEALDYLDETPCGCSMRTYITKYCPNCGAKMKGGE